MRSSHTSRGACHLRRSVLMSMAAAAIPNWVRAAEGWPAKPIKLVHAFAAGSTTDNTGRMLAERLTQSLGQPVVVENRPGANMIIGTEYAAKQPADGYTMTIGTCDNMAINPSLYRNPGYRATDFDPITLIGLLPLVVALPADTKFNSFADLQSDFASAKRPLSFGTWGVGSFAHMVGEMIRMEAGLGFDYIPFQGASPALNALLGGHIDVALISSASAVEHMAAKRLKIVVVGSPNRMKTLPSVPTFAELGYPNIRATQWHGVFARAGGNKDIIEKLYRETSKVLGSPQSQEQLIKAGYASVDGRSPASFSKFIEDEVAVWSRIIKLSGVTVER